MEDTSVFEERTGVGNIDVALEDEVRKYWDQTRRPVRTKVYLCEDCGQIQIWAIYETPDSLKQMFIREIEQVALMQAPVGKPIKKGKPTIALMSVDEAQQFQQRLADEVREKVIKFMNACHLSILPETIIKLDGTTVSGHDATKTPLEEVSSGSLMKCGWGRMLMAYDNPTEAYNLATEINETVYAYALLGHVRVVAAKLVGDVFDFVTTGGEEFPGEIAKIVIERFRERFSPAAFAKRVAEGKMTIDEERKLIQLYKDIMEDENYSNDAKLPIIVQSHAAVLSVEMMKESLQATFAKSSRPLMNQADIAVAMREAMKDYLQSMRDREEDKKEWNQ
jgi:nucleoside 2-deoxyribosyltransferase